MNVARNGGTMIWDPVKQFACLCKDGFVGERCEKGVPDMNVLFIVNKTLKIIVRMHRCQWRRQGIEVGGGQSRGSRGRLPRENFEI